MNTKIKMLVRTIAISGTIVGIAYATDIVGLTSPLLAVGAHLANVETSGSGHTLLGHPFSVSLETNGPATISTQDAAYSVTGVNGWHSHPGMVIVTLISGSIEWFDENCAKTDYHAGDSWTEGSQLHYFRVIGPTGIHLNATFITAHQAPLRNDELAPACAAEFGLN